ncbi:methylated-DNA--[protein]-cysteine S-methyltransferase [Labedaea rhizosphaerae]|uniref:Methylated-DNA--protein-cysteine methyltransferase n=1 Tax=Labedaea rhizosphaerae TaxID=598644 RepID=A0A4R6SID9_LABRH|nr:methylated-DNA--[protein]-cysteine S-methyltransferase [Labedaea rhizosphaerae]TDQ01433.1 methylated-DNA-[protein]-cysteine S-methyltransferase [Labedaea rhizosphaerae]
MSTNHTTMDSPLGVLTLVAANNHDGALSGIYFTGHKGGPAALGDRDDRAFAQVKPQLDEYFAGARTEFDLPLAPRGDDFQHRVWALLRAIPYGRTRTYGELARELGALPQEVGGAIARNPIMIVIPCHRVIGADGSLTGYAGGLDRKWALLALEEPSPALAGRLF